ncbi:hypothetical protein ABVT39_008054 [Epinephelus coioides]
MHRLQPLPRCPKELEPRPQQSALWLKRHHPVSTVTHPVISFKHQLNNPDLRGLCRSVFQLFFPGRCVDILGPGCFFLGCGTIVTDR